MPAAILDAIEKRARLAPGDIAIVEGIYLSAVAYRLVERGVRVILDAHNVESDLLRQTDLARHPILARLQRRGRWRRAAEAERRLLRAVASVWACSQADADLLRHFASGASPVCVIPNPVPDWCMLVQPIKRPDGIDAVFVGHLGYRPNIAAAMRLARGIFPALRAADASARLTLAGRAPAERLRRDMARYPEVALVSDPMDLAPIYAASTMTLMPLREGGGTRIKALEAMAVGLPVIASTKAVEGLAVAPGRQFLLAESDGEFVEAALRLARAPDLREDLAAAARDFAFRHHGPRAIETAVAAALHEGKSDR